MGISITPCAVRCPDLSVREKAASAQSPFAEAIEKAEAENNSTAAPAPSEDKYTITEEQAGYFREKYGEKYDEDTVYKLYDELADKGITDINYTAYASGYVWAMPLDGLKCRGCFTAGGKDIYGLGAYCGSLNTSFSGSKIFVKDVSRTDEYAYKAEWEAFISAYDREINTWLDALQENIDFERYLKELSEKTGGKNCPSAENRDRVIEGLEKTKSVIIRIFGNNMK